MDFKFGCFLNQKEKTLIKKSLKDGELKHLVIVIPPKATFFLIIKALTTTNLYNNSVSPKFFRAFYSVSPKFFGAKYAVSPKFFRAKYAVPPKFYNRNNECFCASSLSMQVVVGDALTRMVSYKLAQEALSHLSQILLCK